MKSVLTYNCNILDDRTKKGLTEIKPSALKFCYAVNKEKSFFTKHSSHNSPIVFLITNMLANSVSKALSTVKPVASAYI